MYMENNRRKLLTRLKRLEQPWKVWLVYSPALYLLAPFLGFDVGKQLLRYRHAQS
jgi:hypothetical protein